MTDDPNANAALAAEAEAGYEVEQLRARRGKRGCPALPNAPAEVESVRLDPGCANSSPTGPPRRHHDLRGHP